MVLDEGEGGDWQGQGDDGEEAGGQQVSLWEAELTALWEAEAAGRFVGFGRAGEEAEAPAPIS